MLPVIVLLNLAAALRLAQGALHGWRHRVGVHDHLAFRVPRRAPDGLNQGPLGTEEALFVGVEDRDERNLREIEALAQQVDADQRIEFTQAKVADDLHALHSIDIVVHVPHADPHAFQIGGQILRHFLRERRHQHALALRGAQVDFGNQVVDLPFHRLDDDLGVHQPGGADHLFHDLRRFFQLQVARRGADENRLIDVAVKFVEIQRTVVVSGREPEPVFDERVLSRPVARVHGTHLRKRDVRLVDEKEKILREIIQQRVRGAARRAA